MSMAEEGHENVILEAALEYARQGIPVFPCSITKKPLTERGFKDATTDEAQIRAWWAKHPAAIIGMPTGDPSGISVIDLDHKPNKFGQVRDGSAALEELTHGEAIPDTTEAKTPTGGRHIYVQHQPGFKCSTDNELGIDVRAEGGYVCIPPSPGYRWVNPWPMFTPIEAPECLVDLLRNGTPKKRIHDDHDRDARNQPILPANDETDPDHVRAILQEFWNPDDYHDWSTAALALHTLPHGREIWLEWAAQSPKFNAAENGRKWTQAVPSKGITARSILARAPRERLSELSRANHPKLEFDWATGKPAGNPENRAEPISGTRDTGARIEASPFVLVPEDQIPARDWIYGRHLIRRFVSSTIAPGGVGKSTLVFVEAMAMATGKPLLGVSIPRPLRVWVWCLEDPREELDRRFAAIAKHYGITNEDIGGRLFLNSGRDTPLCVARQESKTGAIITEPDMAEVEREIIDKRVDIILIDPFVASHQVSENDNVAINAVMRQWVLLAERCNVAIELVHHTRKNGDGEVTAETSRGAKALTDATRDTRVINQMSEAEAAKFGVENRRLHFRAYSDKANLAPPAEHSEWYRLENVALANGPLGADGDHVGVATRWEIPGPFDKVSKETINAILTAINLGVIDSDGNQTGIPYGESNRGRSKRWVGQVIIDHTGMEEEEAKRAITAWLQAGVLVTEEVEIQRKPATGIRVDRTKWSEIVSRQ